MRPVNGHSAAAPAACAAGAAALPAEAAQDQRPDTSHVHAAFAEFTSHRKALRRFLLARDLTVDTVDDALADLAEAYVARRWHGPVENPRPYLFTMAKNYLVNAHRKATRQVIEVPAGHWDDRLERLAGHERSAEEIVATSTLNSELLLKVESLPDRQRQAIHLVYLTGLPTDEAADAMGLSVATFRRYHRRALVSLRALMRAATTVGDFL